MQYHSSLIPVWAFNMRGLRAIPLSLEGATRPGGRDCAESPRAARERAVIPRGEAGGRAGLRRADAPAGRVLPPSEGRGSALTRPARRRPAGGPTDPLVSDARSWLGAWTAR